MRWFNIGFRQRIVFRTGAFLLGRAPKKGERFDDATVKGRRTNKTGDAWSGATTWRLAHRSLGALVLALGFVNISLGVFLAVLPLPVWIIWYIYLGFLVLILVGMEIVQFIRGDRGKKSTRSSSFAGKIRC